MFDPKSRYAALATTTHLFPDGREVRFVRRRFVPPLGGDVLVEHKVEGDDRLDRITARYLGDSEAFWRVCDANLVIHPPHLTHELGARIAITLPRL